MTCGGIGASHGLPELGPRPLVDLEGALGGALPRELPGLLERAALEPQPQRVVLDDPAQRVGPGARARGRRRAARCARRGRRWSGRRRPRRRPACRSPAPRRRPGRRTRCRTVRRPAWRRSTSGRARSWATGGTNRTTSSRPSWAASCGQRLGVLEAAAGRAADDRDDESRRAAPGSAPSSSATARSSTSGALSGWIRPAKSSTSASAGRPSSAPDGGLVVRAGRRRGRRRGGPPRRGRVGVVQVDQLPGLEVGVGDQHVGGLDHLLLADDAGVRLGGVALGQGVVLDLGHRVHRVHQRHAPAVARQRADLAGEPVVGVHDVVVARRGCAASARSTSRAKTHSWPGSSSLVSPSNGPAWMCRTRTPSPAATTGSRAELVARVKMSTSMPWAAIRRASSMT